MEEMSFSSETDNIFLEKPTTASGASPYTESIGGDGDKGLPPDRSANTSNATTATEELLQGCYPDGTDEIVLETVLDDLVICTKESASVPRSPGVVQKAEESTAESAHSYDNNKNAFPEGPDSVAAPCARWAGKDLSSNSNGEKGRRCKDQELDDLFTLLSTDSKLEHKHFQAKLQFLPAPSNFHGESRTTVGEARESAPEKRAQRRPGMSSTAGNDSPEFLEEAIKLSLMLGNELSGKSKKNFDIHGEISQWVTKGSWMEVPEQHKGTLEEEEAVLNCLGNKETPSENNRFLWSSSTKREQLLSESEQQHYETRSRSNASFVCDPTQKLDEKKGADEGSESPLNSHPNQLNNSEHVIKDYEEQLGPPHEFIVDTMNDEEIPGESQRKRQEQEEQQQQQQDGGSPPSSRQPSRELMVTTVIEEAEEDQSVSSIYHAAHTESLMSNISGQGYNLSHGNASYTSAVSGIDVDRQILERELTKYEGMRVQLQFHQEFDGDREDFNPDEEDTFPDVDVLWANPMYIRDNDEGRKEIFIPSETVLNAVDVLEQGLQMKLKSGPRRKREEDNETGNETDDAESMSRHSHGNNPDSNDDSNDDSTPEENDGIPTTVSTDSDFSDTDISLEDLPPDLAPAPPSSSSNSNLHPPEHPTSMEEDEKSRDVSDSDDSIYDVDYMGRWDLFWPIMSPSQRRMVGAPSQLETSVESGAFIISPPDAEEQKEPSAAPNEALIPNVVIQEIQEEEALTLLAIEFKNDDVMHSTYPERD